PRVPAAQVFGETCVVFHAPVDLEEERPRASTRTRTSTIQEDRMTNVRQFAEGLIQYLRGVVGAGEPGTGPYGESADTARIASEREALQAERESVRAEKIEQQIQRFKNQGLLRATEDAESIARAILGVSVTSVVQF